jgi:K+-transporting ATPase ATPase C chain
MLNHIRANLLLLAATLLLCSVVYPLILWLFGQTAFHDQAEGSLIVDDGKVRGSRLIAQPFSGAKYFKPRPSAVTYDASASGASNYAASNPLLRDRVARQLATIVRYAEDSPVTPGELVGPDIEAWYPYHAWAVEHLAACASIGPGMTIPMAQRYPAQQFPLTWAKEHPALAEQWIKDNYEAVANFLETDKDQVKNKAKEWVLPFFEAYVKVPDNRTTWPEAADKEDKKVIERVTKGEALRAHLFDLWLSDNKYARLEKVPADMVMASGSGLDPHITMANAKYQLGGIADEWAKEIQAPRDKVVAEIEKLLDEKKFAPMFGLFGDPMVNVLEVNLELPKRMEALSKPKG